MKLITEITIKIVEDIDEKDATNTRMSFESGDIMEIERVNIIEEMVELLSLKGEKDDVHVSFNLIDDEDDEE
jgi:hypothetical protein